MLCELQAMKYLDSSAQAAAEHVATQKQAAAQRLETLDAELDRQRGQHTAKKQRQAQRQTGDLLCDAEHLAQMYAPAVIASCTQEGAEVVALRQVRFFRCNTSRNSQPCTANKQRQTGDLLCDAEHLAQMYAPAVIASCTQEGAEVVALRQVGLP